ncbi:tetratricopeptide repeat protein [Lactobacillus paragasseri]|uniref:Tetratricopeptide repeat protein n=1 Tax=Lactobacillus paragasseri TaxID=2107999 RepID=A0ABD4ZZD7_9LACO|nr:hypothetical protein [Lactobacillus paragasseri]MDK7952186.1 hypothetical protein [Lactobacillus paragasseri]MDO6360840.1 hypothetical protein [Lactobacillus paragasseri]
MSLLIIFLFLVVGIIIFSISKERTSDNKSNKPDNNLISSQQNDLQPTRITQNESIQSNNITNNFQTKKRINPNTGYPMSTDWQIDRAKALALDAENPSQLPDFLPKSTLKEAEEINEILPHYSWGDYYYKSGNWDKAEQEWSEISDRMPLANHKLCIMYRKQKRFNDVVYILKRDKDAHKVASAYRKQKFESIVNAKAMAKKKQKSDLSHFRNN